MRFRRSWQPDFRGRRESHRHRAHPDQAKDVPNEICVKKLSYFADPQAKTFQGSQGPSGRGLRHADNAAGRPARAARSAPLRDLATGRSDDAVKLIQAALGRAERRPTRR